MGDIMDAQLVVMKSAERSCRPVVWMVLIGLISSLLTVAMTTVGASPAQAASGDFGYADASLGSFGSSTPTASKPESKLWYAAGSWWASMAVTTGYHIYRLNRPTNTWTDTGVALDDRSSTRADVLWNGTHLFVASHVSASSSTTTSSSSPTRLYRYSLNGAVWTKDSGFPVNIVGNSSETFVIDQDGAGRLWGTYTLNSAPYVVVSAANADASSVSFTTPFVPGVSGTGATADDISSVISANGRTTIMWGNQNDDTMRFAYHVDGAVAGDWTGGTALSGAALADDHINMKAIPGDSQGRIFAVTKTSRNDVSTTATDPLIELLVYTASSNSWTSRVVATIADFPTRPILSLDPGANQIHVYYTAPNSSSQVYNGTIYEKTTSLSSPSFASGRGTPVIRDSANATMNNATTTKQPLSSTTGEVVLAATESSPTYWHLDTLGGQLPVTPPVASFTPSTTTGTAPLSVTFTDTSTGTPTSWSWDFGDGSPAVTTKNASHLYAAGTWTVTLTASNAGGPSTATTTIAVTPTPPPAPTASFTASTTSGTAPLTVNFTDTSTGTPTSWSWNFGDGATDTTQNPSHLYAAGTWTVTLTATNAGGPSAQATKTITVNPAAVPPPVASFTGLPTSGTIPLTVAFTDASTGIPTSWSWNFGDGATDTTQNPSHTYTAVGIYKVTLIASNAGGPSNEFATTVNANPAIAWSLRINAGGAAIAGGWTGDLSPTSAYGNATAAKSWTSSTSTTITMTDPSIPVGTPMAMFQRARADGGAGAAMKWTIPVPQPGQYLVRLYFAENQMTAAGKRKFSVAINGTAVLTNFDIFAAAGGQYKGIARAFTVSATGSIVIAFSQVKEVQIVQGIEVIKQ